MHTWLSTQDEGWWRLAFDQMEVPFDYISTQDVAKDPDLNKKYDVIIFGPGRPAISMPSSMAGRCMAIRFRGRRQQLTPNLGNIDSTDDMRPGLGYAGVTNLQNFVKNGGVFIGSDDSADFAVVDRFHTGSVDSALNASARNRRSVEDANG